MNISNKGAVLGFIIGVLLGLFFLFGQNIRWFEGKEQLLPIFLIAGIVLLYISVIGIVNNRYNLVFGLTGFVFSNILSIPLVFVTNVISITNYKAQPEKEFTKIEIVKDSLMCTSIQYGVFANGLDTLIRANDKGYDYEIYITNSKEIKYKIN